MIFLLKVFEYYLLVRTRSVIGLLLIRYAFCSLLQTPLHYIVDHPNIIFGPLYIIFGPLYIIFGPLYIIFGPLYIIFGPLYIIFGPLYIIFGPLYIIFGPLYIIFGPLYIIYGPLSPPSLPISLLNLNALTHQHYCCFFQFPIFSTLFPPTCLSSTSINIA